MGKAKVKAKQKSESLGRRCPALWICQDGKTPEPRIGALAQYGMGLAVFDFVWSTISSMFHGELYSDRRLDIMMEIRIAEYS